MSYQSQAQLEADYWFAQRNRACVMQQSETYINDGRADIAACAQACLRDEPGPVTTFIRMAAAGPGIANEVDQGDGTIDSTLVGDGEILALTQANFPVVASLFFDSTGAPVEAAP